MQHREKANRKSRTKAESSVEDLNILFFERNVLQDEVARRRDEVRRLRARGALRV